MEVPLYTESKLTNPEVARVRLVLLNSFPLRVQQYLENVLDA